MKWKDFRGHSFVSLRASSEAQRDEGCPEQSEGTQRFFPFASLRLRMTEKGHSEGTVGGRRISDPSLRLRLCPVHLQDLEHPLMKRSEACEVGCPLLYTIW